MMLCVNLQYMVLYQLLLAILFNMTFFMDGSTVSYRQVRNVVRIADVHRQDIKVRLKALQLSPHCCLCIMLRTLLNTKYLPFIGISRLALMQQCLHSYFACRLNSGMLPFIIYLMLHG